jgi:hypothetical protein
MSLTGKALRIAFPVVDAAPYCMSLRGPALAIILTCEPILPAGLLRDPVPHCKVIGQLQGGRKVEFTIPLHVWREALANPVLFHSSQPDSIGAATGVLYGPDGKPLPRLALPVRGSNGLDTV